MKTVPQTATAQLCKDSPYCYALALNEWRFDSTRIAIRKHQVVQLEFTPSMVVVHDALHPSTANFTNLGVILYSFPFPYFRSPKLSVRSVQEDGIVREGMQFHLIFCRYNKDIGAECLYCGKLWLWDKQDRKTKSTKVRTEEVVAHLNRHTKEVLL